MKANRLMRGAAVALLLTATAATAVPRQLTILHTNDTHSQIDPDDADGLGGAGRRMAVIDSVRRADDNVLLIDAGDAVQGTLYFNLAGGAVEQKVMNAMEYDLRILGNHEFDNGVDSLAAVLSQAEGQFLATNYDLSATPLGNRFDRYAIRDIDGRRIGFIGINLRPEGMIAEGNYDGVAYLDAIEAANAAAWWLRNVEHCDMVIAITHIGYNPATPPGDVLLARGSDNIDIIIGGHSHDLITPGSDRYSYRIPNSRGRDVLVTQVGKAGKNIGRIAIDLDSLTADYSTIAIDSRLDSRVPDEFYEITDYYRHGVDSLMTRTPVGKTARELPQTSAALLNWMTDYVLERGRELAPDVDLAILNKGGLRRGLPKGTVHEGQIITMVPFNNHIQVIDVKGSDLLETLGIMARTDGNGLSAGMDVTYRPGSEDLNYQDAEVVSATLDGRPIDPDRTYRIATIDYLAGGGDYMAPLKRHNLVAASDRVLYKDLLHYLRNGAGRGRTIKAADTVRMHP